jgi:hypothetical protein
MLRVTFSVTRGSRTEVPWVKKFAAGDTETYHVEILSPEGGVTVSGLYGNRQDADEAAGWLGPALARVTGPHKR